MNQQKSELQSWCEKQLGEKCQSFIPLHTDASPRVYYRAVMAEQSWVVMDSACEKHSLEPYIQIGRQWLIQGVRVPNIMAHNVDKGWCLIEDFGDELLERHLSESNVETLYADLMQAICRIQNTNGQDLPLFDDKHITLELSYFKEWFLAGLMQQPLDDFWSHALSSVEREIHKVFTEQPQVPIHRDFHCRNIMTLPDNDLGIIDFQDAMLGPVSYDLISLIKDCYLTWPVAKVLRWQKVFFSLCFGPNEPGLQTFLRWCDWTGLQRHLKVLGIFARLHLRDNKARYLQDIPRVMTYVLQVTQKYPECEELDAALKSLVVPQLEEVLAKQRNEKVA